MNKGKKRPGQRGGEVPQIELLIELSIELIIRLQFTVLVQTCQILSWLHYFQRQLLCTPLSKCEGGES